MDFCYWASWKSWLVKICAQFKESSYDLWVSERLVFFRAKGQRVLVSQQNVSERQQCNCVLSGKQMSKSFFLVPLTQYLNQSSFCMLLVTSIIDSYRNLVAWQLLLGLTFAMAKSMQSNNVIFTRLYRNYCQRHCHYSSLMYWSNYCSKCWLKFSKTNS